ncbi:MAG: cell division protein FtsB [Gammaproteobacteria bacterium]
MKTILVMLLLVLLMLQVRLWAGAGGVAEIVQLENAIDAQNAENAELQARNDVLMEDVSDLRNGLDSIEERARNELGLIRRGETFYLMVDEEPMARDAAPPAVESVRPPDALPDPLPDRVAPEPPPEIAEDDNPYLQMFRDEQAAPVEQAPAAGPTADQ